VIFLNQSEANSVFEEIFDACTTVVGLNLTVIPPSNAKSEGYQVYITIPVDNQTQKCVKQIAKKHKCSILKNEDVAVIYRPKNRI
jgi:hypothetical protein